MLTVSPAQLGAEVADLQAEMEVARKNKDVMEEQYLKQVIAVSNNNSMGEGWVLGLATQGTLQHEFGLWRGDSTGGQMVCSPPPRGFTRLHRRHYMS